MRVVEGSLIQASQLRNRIPSKSVLHTVLATLFLALSVFITVQDEACFAHANFDVASNKSTHLTKIKLQQTSTSVPLDRDVIVIPESAFNEALGNSISR